MLELKNIRGGYNKNQHILNGIDLLLHKGEVLAIVGQNGSGKSTLVKAIINALDLKQGKVLFNGQDITHTPTYKMPQIGIASFTQGGNIFPNLTVKQHLKLITKEELVTLNHPSFEVLKKYVDKEAGILSGGERNLLALVMELIHIPNLIILDEPTAGLSPIAANKIYAVLEELKKNGTSIILIEQNIQKAIAICDRVVVLQNGRIIEDIKNINYKNTLIKVEQLFFK